MGRLKFAALCLAMLVCSLANAQDYYEFNYDEKTRRWLEANTATQAAGNMLQNEQVDSIKKKQTRLSELVNTIMLNKQFLIQTYQNVSGFKAESRYYKLLVSVGADVVNHSAVAVKAINNSKLAGKADALLQVSGLVTKAVGLGKAFADIVANSKVPNPINHTDAKSGDGDGHNLLNRHERLAMANDIIVRLQSIDRSLQFIIYVSRTSNLSDLVRHLDMGSYARYIMANVEINGIINKWNSIKK